MPEIKYIFPDSELTKMALEFTRQGLEGAELYTYISVNGYSLTPGEIWCGKAEDNSLCSVIINNGKQLVSAGICDCFLYSLIPPVKQYTMVLSQKGAAEYNDMPLTSTKKPPVGKITNKQIMQLYMLYGKTKACFAYDNNSNTAENFFADSKLSPGDEQHYIYRVRCLNKGHFCGFCITDERGLASCASVIAQNETHCLIGDVFTRPDKRKNGFAGECLKSCVLYALQHKKIPFLYCEEANINFYKHLGFEVF